MATIGQTLTAPESGWKRYDNTDSNINYYGNWNSFSNSGYYGGTHQFTQEVGSKITFVFKGTKLRLLANTGATRDNNVKITIDGSIEYYDNVTTGSTVIYQCLVYEKIGLENKLHTVTIEKVSNNTSYVVIDAIDIDNTGALGSTNKILLLSDEKIYSFKQEDIKHETKMTSNTAPAPFVVSASSQYNSAYASWRAFNGTNLSAEDVWMTTTSSSGEWVQINFGSKRKVNYVEVTGSNGSGQIKSQVKDFNILGSNDGVNFEVLGEIRGLTSWNPNETKGFKIKNGDYSHYRLVILGNNGEVRTTIGQILYSHKKSIVVDVPTSSEKNFISYGAEPPIQTDGIFVDKNYILQDTVSEDSNGHWATKIDRKPLSIKFD